MATFKVTEDFDIDVSELDAAGFNINTKLTGVTDISTMATAHQFYQQHRAIKALLDLYASLITKEAKDFRNMATDARALDQAIGTGLGR